MKNCNRVISDYYSMLNDYEGVKFSVHSIDSEYCIIQTKASGLIGSSDIFFSPGKVVCHGDVGLAAFDKLGDTWFKNLESLFDLEFAYKKADNLCQFDFCMNCISNKLKETLTKNEWKIIKDELIFVEDYKDLKLLYREYLDEYDEHVVTDCPSFEFLRCQALLSQIYANYSINA